MQVSRSSYFRFFMLAVLLLANHPQVAFSQIYGTSESSGGSPAGPEEECDCGCKLYDKDLPWADVTRECKPGAKITSSKKESECCKYRSEMKNNAFDCQNLKPTAPPWSIDSIPPPGNGVVNGVFQSMEYCGFYRNLLTCQKGCTQGEKNRLIGYFQTCSGMTQLASGTMQASYGLDSDGRNLITACSLNSNFRQYVNNMRTCLQVGAAAQLGRCEPCGDVVKNIIEVHTPCNANTGFCSTIGNDPQALRCFGAALGGSWQGVGGGHSMTGPLRSVGFCHMLSQALTCAAKKDVDFTLWWHNLCGGYQKGCEMSGGSNCSLSCPTAMPSWVQFLIGRATQMATQGGESLMPGFVPWAEAECIKRFGYRDTPTPWWMWPFWNGDGM